MRAVLLLVLTLPRAGTAFAQSADPSVKFEAATVKLGVPRSNFYGHLGTWAPENDSCSGGPGTSDPSLLKYDLSFASLLVQAYQLAPVQFAPPEWMENTELKIEAKVPHGATPEQVRLMAQNLLAERFKLAVHCTKKDVAAYEMVVSKQGPKFNVASVGPPSQGTQEMPIWKGRVHIERPRSMEQLAAFLSTFTDLPVFDGTRLTGKYNIDLTFGDSMPWLFPPFSDPVPGGPPLAAALRDQLGLVLERTKIPADVLIVDHVEQRPTKQR